MLINELFTYLLIGLFDSHLGLL